MIDSDGISKLAYGTHPDIIDEDPSDDLQPSHGNQAGVCPAGDPRPSCVQNALVAGNKIRVILDELVKGGTVEQFECACWANGCATRGYAFLDTEVDPTRCTDCQDDPTTPDVSETGLCTDANFDGVPDNAFLLPGKLSLDCGVATVAIDEDSGWYNPSGNQLIPTLGGTDALGPALVMIPPALPTNADCTVVVDPSVVDHDNNPVANDPNNAGSPSFHTQPMVMVVTTPGDGQTGVSLSTEISVIFNTDLDPTLGGTAMEVTVTDSATSTTTPVTGTVAVDAADSTKLVFTPDADLLPSSAGDTMTYTVTLHSGAQGVKDSFGSPLPADQTFSFTTGQM